MENMDLLKQLVDDNNNNNSNPIKRKWMIKSYQPFYFDFEGKVYRLDSDFCVFDVNPANNFSIGQYYGCYTVHDSYDDEHLGYIEYNPLTEFTRVPRNVENYFRNVVFDQIMWACGCEFLAD